jgi:hypothetical protein
MNVRLIALAKPRRSPPRTERLRGPAELVERNALAAERCGLQRLRVRDIGRSEVRRDLRKSGQGIGELIQSKLKNAQSIFCFCFSRSVALEALSIPRDRPRSAGWQPGSQKAFPLQNCGARLPFCNGQKVLAQLCKFGPLSLNE